MVDETNKDNLDDTLSIRVNSKELSIFKRKSERVTGKPYQLFLRELMSAFNDGRITIIATEEQKRELKDLYK
jgi:predicted DNA binding CopG/RHH family protein